MADQPVRLTVRSTNRFQSVQGKGGASAGRDWRAHLHRWKDCDRCDLCNTRVETVLGRGDIPASVLFIGEAPGVTEDLVGKPFIGRAGVLLDQILHRVRRNGVEPFTYFISNLVGCRPVDTDGRNAKPTPEQMELCRPRLIELYHMVQPKMLIFLGEMATTWAPRKIRVANGRDVEIPSESVYHPAYALRQGGITSKAGMTIVQDLTRILKGLA
jgi:uracil-DNA glycosylase